MTSARILVLDGNDLEHRAKQVAALGYDTGTGYARILHRIDASLRVDILCVADAEPVFPTGAGLDTYDGVAMTGSRLNIYSGGKQVTRQIDFVKAVFAAGVPYFGSCWGLQVAVTAAGGEVRANPRGREFGFARRILVSAAGRDHALFAGKPLVFEAPAIHRDEIVTLPSGGTVLADNDFGIQAASFVRGRSTIWGVQYHPEYDYMDIAATAERYSDTLIMEGMFSNYVALATFAGELRSLQSNPSNIGLLWKHGLGLAARTESLRLLEIRNWLKVALRPR